MEMHCAYPRACLFLYLSLLLASSSPCLLPRPSRIRLCRTMLTFLDALNIPYHLCPICICTVLLLVSPLRLCSPMNLRIVLLHQATHHHTNAYTLRKRKRWSLRRRGAPIPCRASRLALVPFLLIQPAPPLPPEDIAPPTLH